MNRRLAAALRTVAMVALVAMPVAADAPEDQYAPFTRQNRQIRDLKTRLEWERSTSPRLTFAEARDNYCLPPTRLPTLKELLTIVDEEPHLDYDDDEAANVQKAIDFAAFTDTDFSDTPVDRPYWTSSIDPGGQVFTVSFADGATRLAAPAEQLRARCVRYVP